MHYCTRFSSKAKRVSIKIEPPNQVLVVAPKRTPKKILDKFVKEQSAWITKQLARMVQKQDSIESNTQVLIFGKTYQKKFGFNHNLPIGILFTNNQILFNFPDSNTLQKNKLVKSELEIFLKKTARKYLQEKTKALAEKMQVKYKKITLRNQKTRWGSCSSNNTLSLNWRLVHYPPEIIDYVLVHELAHLIHHNHSKKFWELVALYDPKYRQHKNYLKKYGVTLN
jgi:hypothetical protein